MKSILKVGLVLVLCQGFAIHAATVVTNVAGGLYHSLFLMSDGSLWAMGENGNGQLGDGTFNTNGMNRPEQIVSSNVVAAAGGYYFSLFLKGDGSLWGMGHNRYGQLGDGTFSTSSPFGTNRPEQIVSGNVVAIVAGAYHSVFLKSDGSLWAMGRNTYGQLGDGTTNNINAPEQIVPGGVVAIAAGDFHTLFAKSDGSLWGVGNNQFGQLGDGTTNNVLTPEQIVSGGIRAIAAGNVHSVFVKSNGSLWSMGWNYYAQLGDGTFNTTNKPEQIVASDVVTVAGGLYHNLFLTTGGGLWAFGFDLYGQLGDGRTGVATNKPEQIIPGNVTAIAAGGDYSLFVKSDGSLWGMGRNEYGPLGDGFSASACPLPEQIVPSPQPMLTESISSATHLQFNATCQFGGTFRLLTSANLAQPLSRWTCVATNVVSVRGANNFVATETNGLSAGTGAQFYILQSQ